MPSRVDSLLDKEVCVVFWLFAVYMNYATPTRNMQ